MGRLWLIARVAETFHVLPSVAARDLDEDPELLSLLCLPLLNYAEAKGVYDSQNKHLIEGLRKRAPKLLQMIEDNDLAMAAEDIRAQERAK